MGDFFSGASEGIDIMAEAALARNKELWEREKFARTEARLDAAAAKEANDKLLADFGKTADQMVKEGIEGSDPDLVQAGHRMREQLGRAKFGEGFSLPREDIAAPSAEGFGAAADIPETSQYDVPLMKSEKEALTAKLTKGRQLEVEAARQENRLKLAQKKAENREELARLKDRLKGKEDKDLTPAQKLKKLELEATRDFLEGKASKEQIRFLKLGEKTGKPPAPEITKKRQMEIDAKVKEAEQIIVAGDLDDPRLQTEMDFFNKHADKGYIYSIIEEAGALYGTNKKLVKIKLPKVNGKQVKAKDLDAGAEEYKEGDVIVNDETGEQRVYSEEAGDFVPVSVEPVAEPGAQQEAAVAPQQKPTTLDLAQSVKELDKMLPPKKYAGFQEMPYPWDNRLTSIQEHLASLAQTTQATQDPKLGRIGEDRLTTAIRLATSITKIRKLNDVAKKLRAVYEELDDDQLAELVESGQLLGGSKKKVAGKATPKEDKAVEWLLQSMDRSA